MKQHGLFDEPQESPPLATMPPGAVVLAQDESSVHGVSISQDRTSPPVEPDTWSASIAFFFSRGKS